MPSPDAVLPNEAAAAPIPTPLWQDATADLLPPTAEWTNKVELADIDGDGRIDLLFANGGNYSEPGTPEPNRAFLNRGPGQPFEERSAQVFGPAPDLARVIKARDFDGDGDTDIFVGATYQTQSRLYLATGGGTGGGAFEERTDTHLPRLPLSLGDAEPGDVDGDGDLDLVLADWGPGNNMTNAGGRTRLWLNDGAGRFTDATEGRMPATLVRFSWDLELADVDNDFDLDVLVSCKRCAGSLLFRNDGTGVFEEDPRGLPQYTNNYEFEAMDLDGDGFLDLVTINDGEIVGERGSSRREHVFRNDGEGSFRDATDAWWPAPENIGEDDNVVAFLDFDSDGDADFLIGSLSGPDRLLVNDGTGRLRAALEVFEGEDTPGTLGMAIADLDGDARIDVVMSQGEHPTAVEERVFLGRGLAPDTAPPVVGPVRTVREADVGAIRVTARVHDRKSPTLAAEWQYVEVRWSAGFEEGTVPMLWYGEYLWWARIPPEATEATVCAADDAGNETCRDDEGIEVGHPR
ncbi:FG-GAP repeat domain-containing protein [Candidatus Palauibacter sp.]|uniref:FG-GAP repeat domain-containing protein n=1 Tax=Candidatus Palauibacter sp. TaxID=3101350 RepID=UPI003B597B42